MPPISLPKKSIPYRQALLLNRICSNNVFFDKRCNELEHWLHERGYSERVVRQETPDKEHQNVFRKVPIVGFRNGKSLKDHLVRASLPILNHTLGNESCGKRNCQACQFFVNTDTFSPITTDQTLIKVH